MKKKKSLKVRGRERESVGLKNYFFLYNPMNSEVAYMQPYCN